MFNVHGFTFNLLLAASAVVTPVTSLLGYEVYVNDRAAQRSHHDEMLLTLMRGGIAAVTARCLIETEYVEAVQDCVKASTPVQGREL